jgi:hypothetical protein
MEQSKSLEVDRLRVEEPSNRGRDMKPCYMTLVEPDGCEQMQ